MNRTFLWLLLTVAACLFLLASVFCLSDWLNEEGAADVHEPNLSLGPTAFASMGGVVPANAGTAQDLLMLRRELRQADSELESSYAELVRLREQTAMQRDEIDAHHDQFSLMASEVKRLNVRVMRQSYDLDCDRELHASIEYAKRHGDWSMLDDAQKRHAACVMAPVPENWPAWR